MSAGTAHLGIMTADDFKNRTKATSTVCGFSSHFKSRGSSMATIDRALEQWDRICMGSKTKWDEYQRMEALTFLRLACDEYLNEKTEKGSALSGHRKSVVNDLKRTVENATAFVKKRGASTPATQKPATGLKPGYALERKDYEASGKKQNPYSASAMHDAAGHPDMATANHAQFVKFGIKNNVDNVQFLNRAQRLDYLVVVRDGRLLRNGKPLTSDKASGKIFSDTYAMDRYGVLYSYTFKQVGEAPDGKSRFNHSSYCAGREVLCAGTLAANDGKLLYVSNLSGHYKPDAGALHSMLVILGQEGVDLDEVALDYAPHSAGWSKATTYVNSPGTAPADWPHTYIRTLASVGTSQTEYRVIVDGVHSKVSNPA